MEKKQKLEIDIELKDIFFEFLRKWRIILCGMLIGGMLLGTLAFVSDYRAAGEVVTPIIQTPKTPEEIIAELNIDELEKVIAAVQLKAQIDAKAQYISESVLMTINPFAADCAVLEYRIEGDMAAIDHYQTWIENGGFLEAADVYVGELVSSEVNMNTLTVQILHKDAQSCKELAEEVKTALENYAMSLQQSGIAHTVKLVQETQSVVVDDELHEFQDTYLKDNITDQTSLAKMKAEMSGNQVSAYLHMERDVFEREEAGKNEQANENANTQTNTENTAPDRKVSIDMKQILLGMVLGAVLAVVYIFLAYIMTGKLRTVKEAEHIYGVKLLGNVCDKTGKSRKFKAVDEAVWNLEHIKEKKLSFEEQVELAAASICIQCQQHNLKKVYAAGSNMSQISEKLLHALKNELKKYDIELEIGKELNYDASALLHAAKTGSVVLLEKKRHSAYKNILKCMQTCGTNDIRVLGMIVTEE